MESTHILLPAVIGSECEDLDVNFYLIPVPSSSLNCAAKLYAEGICNVVFIPTNFFVSFSVYFYK